MWEIVTTDTFDDWFDKLKDSDRANVLAGMLLLRETGSHLSRPYADTVNASNYSNMKELRIQSKGDPLRVFLLLIQTEKEFYSVLVTKWKMKNAFTSE